MYSARIAQLRRAFSLVEAAVILGVVGLVIGGIWIAATSVSEERKFAQLTEGLISMYTRAASLLPASMLSQLPDGQHVISSVYPSGSGLPAGFTYKSGVGQFFGPYDTTLSILTGTFWATEPNYAIGLDVRSTANAAGSTSTNEIMCRKLVSRLTAIYKPGGDLLRVVFTSLSTGTAVHVTSASFPIAFDTPNCTYPRLFFVFRPQQ